MEELDTFLLHGTKLQTYFSTKIMIKLTLLFQTFKTTYLKSKSHHFSVDFETYLLYCHVLSFFLCFRLCSRKSGSQILMRYSGESKTQEKIQLTRC